MIKLQRTIKIETFDVEGTVAVGRDRPEYLAVAQLASNLERAVSGDDVSRELLGGLPTQVGWRVVERCIALGLLEREGHRGSAQLSESGKAALTTSQVLVPEEGTWRFYLVHDPLIESPLLHVQRFESPEAKDERRELKKGNTGGSPGNIGQRLPSPIIDAKRTKAILSSIATAQSFQVMEVADRGAAAMLGELTLRLHWEPGSEPVVALRGHLLAPTDKKSNAATHGVDKTLSLPSLLSSMSYEELWMQLMSHGTETSSLRISTWCRRSERLVLPVSFDDCQNNSERRGMRRDVEVPQLSLRSLGEFEATTLQDVEMMPESDREAEAWLHWLQWDELGDYVVPEQLQQRASSLVGRFPLHSTDPLSPEEMLEQASAEHSRPKSRYLLAPADLGLWRKS